MTSFAIFQPHTLISELIGKISKEIEPFFNTLIALKYSLNVVFRGFLRAVGLTGRPPSGPLTTRNVRGSRASTGQSDKLIYKVAKI